MAVAVGVPSMAEEVPPPGRERLRLFRVREGEGEAEGTRRDRGDRDLHSVEACFEKKNVSKREREVHDYKKATWLMSPSQSLLKYFIKTGIYFMRNEKLCLVLGLFNKVNKEKRLSLLSIQYEPKTEGSIALRGPSPTPCRLNIEPRLTSRTTEYFKIYMHR